MQRLTANKLEGIDYAVLSCDNIPVSPYLLVKSGDDEDAMRWFPHHMSELRWEELTTDEWFTLWDAWAATFNADIEESWQCPKCSTWHSECCGVEHYDEVSDSYDLSCGCLLLTPDAHAVDDCELYDHTEQRKVEDRLLYGIDIRIEDAEDSDDENKRSVLSALRDKCVRLRGDEDVAAVLREAV